MIQDVPKVSILIPVYDQKEYIGQTLESALAQTYPNKEIVVADDNSSDGSWQALQKYQAHPQIKLYRNQQNLGMTGNHHHLLYDLSQGDYTVILDGDDYFVDNNFISEAVQMAEQNNLPLVFAEALVLNSGGATKPMWFPFSKNALIPYQEIFRQGILFMHGAVLFKRKLALPYKFYAHDIIGEDNINFLRFIIGKKVGFLKRSVYVYRKHTDPAHYSVQQRVQNNVLVDAVYDFALLQQPNDRALFSKWRQKMLSVIFYGHLIHLLRHEQLGLTLNYLVEYLHFYGVRRFFEALKHPKAVYSWVYQRSWVSI